jgi:hypothetical protein
MRLSIEVLKEDTIQTMNNFNVKSPRQWRDNLIAFRIRRKIINREDELTIKQKEEVYNGSHLSEDDMASLEYHPKTPINYHDKSFKNSPKKCLPQDTIKVLNG